MLFIPHIQSSLSSQYLSDYILTVTWFMPLPPVSPLLSVEYHSSLATQFWYILFLLSLEFSSSPFVISLHPPNPTVEVTALREVFLILQTLYYTF